MVRRRSFYLLNPKAFSGLATIPWPFSPPFSALRFWLRLPRIAHTDQYLLNLLMQACQYIYPHGYAGDERTFESFGRGCPSFAVLAMAASSVGSMKPKST